MKKIATCLLILSLMFGVTGCSTMSELQKQPNRDAQSNDPNPNWKK